MQYLYSVYFVNQPPHVSGIFVAHHQKVYCIYTTTGMCCAFQLTVRWSAGRTTDSGFGGLVVACWPLVPKFAGSNPAEAVGFLRAKKILSTPSFEGEVKPSVPCRRFAACKRSLNGVEVVISAKLSDNILAHSSHFRRWDLSRRGGRGGTWW